MITRVKGSVFSTQDNLNYVNVTDLGAVGDGATDDTAVFNTALAIGLPVFVPAGTFVVSGLVLSNANAILFGAGSCSVLKLKNATAAPVITVTAAGVEIKDIKIDGNKANQASVAATGIAISNTSNVRVRNVLISNTYGDGVSITGAATLGVYLTAVAVTGFATNGIKIENGTNIHLDSCVTYSSDLVAAPGDGISILPTLPGASINLVTLLGCESRSNVGNGILVSGFGSKNVDNVVISGCIANNNTSNGIKLVTTEQALISSCIAKSNNGDGVRLEGDVVYSRITNSVADSNAGYGIREVVAGSTPDNNTLHYNVARSNVTSNVITKVGAASVVV